MSKCPQCPQCPQCHSDMEQAEYLEGLDGFDSAYICTNEKCNNNDYHDEHSNILMNGFRQERKE